MATLFLYGLFILFLLGVKGIVVLFQMFPTFSIGALCRILYFSCVFDSTFFSFYIWEMFPTWEQLTLQQGTNQSGLIAVLSFIGFWVCFLALLLKSPFFQAFYGIGFLWQTHRLLSLHRYTMWAKILHPIFNVAVVIGVILIIRKLMGKPLIPRLFSFFK